MRKVLVIGAAGWLGRTLVERLLAEGREVVAVDVRIPESWRTRPHLETCEADIRDVSRFKSFLTDCETVFNCCGLQHPTATKDLYSVNAIAPAEVYRACLESGVRTFVHISSIAAHGLNKDGITFITETSALRAVTHYGRSKALGDERLQTLAAGQKTRLIILRPGVFYGASPSKNLTDFMQTVKKSPLPCFSHDGFLRSYIDIEKAVDAMLLSEDRGTSGEAYLISDRTPLCTREFYRIIADELSVRPRIITVPVIVARAAEKAAIVVGRLGLHLRLPTAIGEFGRHTFCWPLKAEQELGFSPHESPEEGLRAMARSTKNRT